MQPTLGDREVTVDYFGRGELLGLHAGELADDEAIAHEDCTLLTVSRSDFDAWLAEHPSASRAIVRTLARACRRTRERLALVTMNGAKARLAALLLDLADRFGVRDSRGVIVDLRLTHREMASLIGATRETVSVAIVELRSEEIVRTEHRRVILLDEPKLRSLAGLDGA
jgi:CRP-like cAMP-binding protein